MEESLKEKTAKGLLWGGVSNVLIQLLGALFGIILLRLLSPDDYGKIAVLLVFSTIATNLQESGFYAALINQKNPSHSQLNAVFWFNILSSMLIYTILWFCAPLIASFYHEPELLWLSRYLFLGFLISSFNIVQRCCLTSNMMAKENGIMTISALIVSNVVGVALAFMGFAFWGLATQTIVYAIVINIFAWHYSSFRPSFNIDLRPAWALFGFSSKLLINNLFANVNAQVLSVILGRLYSTQTVGYYSNARKWNDMGLSTINGMLGSVTHPLLAKVVGDDARYKAVFRKMLRFICFVSFPCMFGLALISEDFILIVVGEQWKDSALMLSMLCVYGAFVPVIYLYDKMAVSYGRSGVNMFCNISVCVLTWIGLIAMHPYGIYYMISFFVAINVLWLFVWQWFAWRLFGLTLWEAMKDILPFLAIVVVVMGFTWFVTSSIDNIYLSIISKIAIAGVLYLGIVYMLDSVIMKEMIQFLTKSKK